MQPWCSCGSCVVNPDAVLNCRWCTTCARSSGSISMQCTTAWVVRVQSGPRHAKTPYHSSCTAQRSIIDLFQSLGHRSQPLLRLEGRFTKCTVCFLGARKRCMCTKLFVYHQSCPFVGTQGCTNVAVQALLGGPPY